MPSLFHRLRTRSRALAHGLLLVLLATWLSAVCPHCLAQATEQPAEASHCHHTAPPVKDARAGHDCCPQAAGLNCTGGNCAQMSSVALVDAAEVAVHNDASPQALMPPATSPLYPALPPTSPPPVYRAAADPCPLYLRNCVFRN